ncbi:alpha-ketoglutarate decarboxylase [Pseudoclavibacter chungangensis]|uniref:Alpha-ketoglutarate decarboxylase n=1 Tax=Pseudoclavibacter chungangensis TaxID=587635 RepID=A0A7J5BPQ4_9MICO|nr:zf-HC2 domain-containing protein [Pseudoclavibacter chungangensis]KAB1655065.1 alpha-ketoglutarate decarboxylase [Pseudoclavibacter chungangensis]NYJ66172.1 anti-sigma factor (TIGR02949 family) [Pseudoclavibacter chungangensis]
MSGCGCDDALRLLEEYLHNELCSADAADIREHVRTCATCREELLVNTNLMSALRRSCRERAPEQVRTQVIVALRASYRAHG